MRALEEGDLATARSDQFRATEMVKALMASGFTAASKSVMAFVGVDCGPVRPPIRNNPSAEQLDALYDKLAPLEAFARPLERRSVSLKNRTDTNPSPASGMTPGASETVAAARALECPIQLEAKLARVNPVMADEYDYSVHERCVECTLEGIVCIEVRITRVHAHPSVLMDGKPNRIDPDRWRPLIMSFQRFYGLGPELSESRLAGIPEAMYRTPDIDRASLAAS